MPWLQNSSGMLERLNQGLIHEIMSTQHSTTSAHSPASLPNSWPSGPFPKGRMSKRDWTCHIIAQCQCLALMWWAAGLDVAKPVSWAKRKDQQLQLTIFTQFKPIDFCNFSFFPRVMFLVDGAEGQSLGKDWPDPWAVTVLNSPWCAGGHSSCTIKISVSGVSHLTPADSQLSIPHHCLTGKEPGWRSLWPSWKTTCCGEEDNLAVE